MKRQTDAVQLTGPGVRPALPTTKVIAALRVAWVACDEALAFVQERRAGVRKPKIVTVELGVQGVAVHVAVGRGDKTARVTFYTTEVTVATLGQTRRLTDPDTDEVWAAVLELLEA